MRIIGLLWICAVLAVAYLFVFEGFTASAPPTYSRPIDNSVASTFTQTEQTFGAQSDDEMSVQVTPLTQPQTSNMQPSSNFSPAPAERTRATTRPDQSRVQKQAEASMTAKVAETITQPRTQISRRTVTSQTDESCPALTPLTTINHFGQPIRLNGANIAWSSNPRYARDIGDDTVDLATFRQHFRTISSSGGNSARWFLHTNGTVTPNVTPEGVVTSLSDYQSNAQIVRQIKSVLDAAWEEGVLVNIVLFTFEMMCNDYTPLAYERMLRDNHMSYIDNALTPMVRGLKDHPALLAWEVFNEAEGQSVGTGFFGDPNLGPACRSGREQPKWVLQRFVNHVAARIHEIDPNVKVTSSVGNPEHFKDYTNSALLGKTFSNPRGNLDFYQLHWYRGKPDPYTSNASAYATDLPVVLGEFAYGRHDDSGTPASMLARRILQNEYAGAWSWSLATEERSQITSMMKNGARCSNPVNKRAIEQCISTKSPDCYRQSRP